MAREGVPLIVIQRQLGHSNLGITSVYLQGIDNAEIIETVHARRAPMVPVTTSRPALPGTLHRGLRVARESQRAHARGAGARQSSAHDPAAIAELLARGSRRVNGSEKLRNLSGGRRIAIRGDGEGLVPFACEV
jgi:hypothetical protein